MIVRACAHLAHSRPTETKWRRLLLRNMIAAMLMLMAVILMAASGRPPMSSV
jgi:hypothetical protein